MTDAHFTQPEKNAAKKVHKACDCGYMVALRAVHNKLNTLKASGVEHQDAMARIRSMSPYDLGLARPANTVEPRNLLGRDASGARYVCREAHAVQGGNWSALCGVKPGPGSDWSDHIAPLVTCDPCARRWAELEPIQPCDPT